MEEKDVARLAKLYGKPLLIKPHHSYDDWYFQGSNWPYYEPTIVVSSPTSLCGRMVASTQYYGHSVLKTYPALPELRIVNNVYIRWDGSAIHGDFIRMQAYPPGGYQYPQNGYWLKFYLANVTFSYIISGAPYTISYKNFSPALTANTWYKYRFSLWDLPNHTAPTSIAYRFELWETGAWKTYLEGTNAPSRWWNSSVNYYGTWLNFGGHYNDIGVCIDDTELWIPAT